MDATAADDRDLTESMRAFQAAVAARPLTLEPPSVSRVLLAIDGSNQDRTALALATSIARRHEAQVIVSYAYEGRRDEHRDGYAAAQAQQLRDDGIDVPLEQSGPSEDLPESSVDRIIGLCRRRHCDLIVVCAPYLEDFAALGEQSVGSNLDLLMARSPVPLLVVREPKDDPAACFEHVVAPVTVHVADNPEAAAWALAMIGDGGSLRVVAVIDREEGIPALPGEIDAERLDERTLAGLRRPPMAGLIAALQRRAAELHLGCRVSVRTGETVPILADLANERDGLIVTGCPRRPEATAFQRVQGLTRASRNPVVIV